MFLSNSNYLTFKDANTVCEDCGNRAKKECAYRRCRTCCRSRAYHCATHVRSTWVPAAVRRYKKTKLPDTDTDTDTDTFQGNTTSTKTFPGFYQQDNSFKEQLPSKVRAPANFKSVRVTALNDGEADIVYQVTVNICGHIFKGFLYNRGVDEKNAYPRISELHLERTASRKSRDSTSPVVDTLNAFVSGN